MLVASAVDAAGSASISVLRPSRAARAEGPGVRAPAHAENERLRAERWRSFPHVLAPTGMDWSQHANRRVGWRPSRPLRNPHARQDAYAESHPEPVDTLFRIAFIRIDFRTDREGSRTTGDGRFDLSGPDTTLPAIDRPPHNRDFYLAHLEAMDRYFRAQSYGRVRIEGDVWPRSRDGAYTVSDMADFGPWRFSPDIYGAAVHMFRTMMFAADSQSIALGDRIPWDSYDRFMIIHAGGDFQSDLRQDSPLDIPSFTIGVDDTNRIVFPDSTTRPIDRACFVPETNNQDGFYGTLNAVIAHENGHNLFGLADLYNVNNGFPVVGLWSLMDSGTSVGTQVALPNGEIIFATGLIPTSVDPFQRFFLGDALHFPEPNWGGTDTLRAIQRAPDVRRVFLTSDEYLLLENRHIAASDTITLDQDSTTRVILGPKTPDALEYDVLAPGPGLLVWHVDASVVPFETAFRFNPGFGWNTNPARPGVSVLEADALADLGDPGSPFFLGSPLDPFFKSNNAVLSDSTRPNLRPHIRTRPHLRIEVLDDPGETMRFRAARAWQKAGWPVTSDFPNLGPLPLAVDADGDDSLEVCWAGGAVGSRDSAAIFVLRHDGRGIRDTSAVLARLPQRPHPLMAAIPLGPDPPVIPGGEAGPRRGPSLFAVTTLGPDTTSGGGKVFLLDHTGAVMPGWPPVLPHVGTPPVITGTGAGDLLVYVGCEDGRVRALDVLGNTIATSALALQGGVEGRLAVDADPPGASGPLVAAGGPAGEIGIFAPQAGVPMAGGRVFTVHDGLRRFQPEFLWIAFDGRGVPGGARAIPAASTPAALCGAGRTLVAHLGDRLWAFCADGTPLPNWGRATGDTLVEGLAAGDPDGDGYPEVLTQSRSSEIAFWNSNGYPTPGWPKRATRERFRTDSPPLALDVDADGRGEVVALNASGILAALDRDGRVPEGWPLATGSGAVGSLVAADLDRDGFLELVAPDRDVPDSLVYEANARFGTLHAFSLPVAAGSNVATSWTMVGGDPGRTATLPVERTPAAGASASGGPYVPGSLKAFPNPARRQPVAFSYQLREPAEVQFDILDPSGHAVASFTRAGRRSDNLEIWDPGRVPAGLYLARLRFRGAGSQHTEVVPVGLLR